MENRNTGGSLWSKNRWLARLSFSFLIVAIYLAYTGYHGAKTHELSQGRVVLCFIAAALGFVLFLMGTRAKHHPAEDEQDEEPR